MKTPLDGHALHVHLWARCAILLTANRRCASRSRHRHGMWVSTECRATFPMANHSILVCSPGRFTIAYPSAVRVSRPDDDTCWCVAMTHQFRRTAAKLESHPVRPTRQQIQDRPLTTGGEHLSGENDTGFYRRSLSVEMQVIQDWDCSQFLHLAITHIRLTASTLTGSLSLSLVSARCSEAGPRWTSSLRFCAEAR
jgi:hypothetical protein